MSETTSDMSARQYCFRHVGSIFRSSTYAICSSLLRSFGYPECRLKRRKTGAIIAPQARTPQRGVHVAGTCGVLSTSLYRHVSEFVPPVSFSRSTDNCSTADRDGYDVSKESESTCSVGGKQFQAARQHQGGSYVRQDNGHQRRTGH